MYLNTHTCYSLRYGTIRPEELLQTAKSKGFSTLSLTDINSTTACIDFVRLAAKYKIRPVLGVDFRNGVQQEFILLARNNQGFKSINEYLSRFLHQKEFRIPSKPTDMAEVFVIYPFSKYDKEPLKNNEFLGVSPDDIPKLKFSRSEWPADKLVMLQTVSFQHKKGFNTHRLLRAIDNNTLLSKLPPSEQGDEKDMMLKHLLKAVSKGLRFKNDTYQNDPHFFKYRNDSGFQTVLKFWH